MERLEDVFRAVMGEIEVEKKNGEWRMEASSSINKVSIGALQIDMEPAAQGNDLHVTHHHQL